MFSKRITTRESAKIYTEKGLITSLTGAANAYVSNNLLGTGRINAANTGLNNTNSVAYQVGQKVGDAASVITGTIETIGGAGGEVLSAGVATPVAIPLTIHGAATTGAGLANLFGNPIRQANSQPNGNSKASSKPQHGYSITEISTKNKLKYCISGQKLNKNGTSPRANN